MCEQAMCVALTTENACMTLMIADMYSAAQLRAHAINFINVNATEVRFLSFVFRFDLKKEDTLAIFRKKFLFSNFENPLFRLILLRNRLKPHFVIFLESFIHEAI